MGDLPLGRSSGVGSAQVPFEGPGTGVSTPGELIVQTPAAGECVPESASRITPVAAAGEQAASMHTNAANVTTRHTGPSRAGSHPLPNRELAPTPIRLDRMLPFLELYDNYADAQRLITGFKQGFSLGFTGARVSMQAKNLKSAYAHPDVVKDKLTKGNRFGQNYGSFLLTAV